MMSDASETADITDFPCKGRMLTAHAAEQAAAVRPVMAAVHSAGSALPLLPLIVRAEEAAEGAFPVDPCFMRARFPVFPVPSRGFQVHGQPEKQKAE
jgi:hypothetical protein